MQPDYPAVSSAVEVVGLRVSARLQRHSGFLRRRSAFARRLRLWPFLLRLLGRHFHRTDQDVGIAALHLGLAFNRAHAGKVLRKSEQQLFAKVRVSDLAT